MYRIRFIVIIITVKYPTSETDALKTLRRTGKLVVVDIADQVTWGGQLPIPLQTRIHPRIVCVWVVYVEFFGPSLKIVIFTTASPSNFLQVAPPSPSTTSWSRSGRGPDRDAAAVVFVSLRVYTHKRNDVG